MLPKLLFFINPNAGHSGIRTDLLTVLELLSRSYEVTVYVTAGPREITEKIRTGGSRYDYLAVSGGDGSLNETVAGLMALSKRPVLGYIPSGTTNDVASSLGLSLNAVKAAEVIADGEPFPLDVGCFNGRYFTYVAAFGAFTSVSYATPQRFKHVFGQLAYLMEGAKSLGTIKPLHAVVSAEGVREEDDFLVGLVCSTTSVGGFRSGNPENLGISLNDGLSEAVFVRYPSDFGELGLILAELAKMDFSNPDHFLAFHTDRVTVEFEEAVPWTVDGEDGGSHKTVEIQNIPQAIQILVPKA